ncbi:DUF3310 domain-containing protein [Prescottella equi]|uniref:DUF3310 domain-containing protein n=1 Tax=Rhodococcus hoagii TaxID=43767 RepID=UPI001FFC48F0|nr:DUF3310 domain-containing protein [Prescottella equi]UPH36715.1 DUF3310 domain-containing protein [Prescottella equi]UPH40834.1 DUF3310 domain-containing protein [Prescottella equi]
MSDHAADPVNHPGHYTSHPSGVECIQVTEHMSFCLGNAIKYIWRADLKGNAIEDLQKARWYVDREIARLGGQPAILDGLAESGELTEAVKTSLTDALDTVLSATGMSVPVLDSGPDGTPEKPWPTAADVPEGVRYTDQADPNAVDGWWVNRGGQRFSVNRRDGHEFASALSDSKMQRLAPFVRVDGDKA